ncbi:hypothetical protein [Corallococcus aberystwythensis]|uniref:hypothetical protein n=1 Tax=Corallococcus aberystwythensis TaxID=2316722 RepID=UPI0013155CC3|nr:hypothetical protein [Corallococcus aberystwythensis]
MNEALFAYLQMGTRGGWVTSQLARSGGTGLSRCPPACAAPGFLPTSYWTKPSR